MWSYTSAPLYAFMTQTSKAHTLHIMYTGRTDRHETDVLIGGCQVSKFQLEVPKDVCSARHLQKHNDLHCVRQASAAYKNGREADGLVYT